MKSDETTAVPQMPAEKNKPIQHSAAFKRKRNMLLMLPLICLPFISLAFWALGGGQGMKTETETTTAGLLLNLPDSKLKEADPADKLRFYEKAEKDSLQLEEWMRTDPYYRRSIDSGNDRIDELKLLSEQTAGKYNYQLNSTPYSKRSTSAEDELMQKLTLLQEQLEAPPAPDKQLADKKQLKKDEVFSAEVDRLQMIMQQMQNNNEENQDLQHIQGTLEKILDIQHPERIKEKLKERSIQERNRVFPVTAQSTIATTGLLDTTVMHGNFSIGFFGTEQATKETEEQAASVIEAVVHTTQTLVNGSIIQLRIANDVFINGNLIPKATTLNGKVSLNDERLEISISSLRAGKQIFPVELEVFDMDGIPGIYIPGAISRDVAKESAQNSLQQMDLITIDPSFRAQAATAGVNTIRQLLGRKVKQVKVVVKEGHRLLLRDKKREQQLSSNN